MPTYEYVCDACEHEFEEFQSMSEKPLKKCPQCGKNKLRRLIGTGAAIMFKGSGFYKTDYRSDTYKKHAEADKSSGNPTESKSDKSETKSASKSESSSGAKSEKKHAAKDKK